MIPRNYHPRPDMTNTIRTLVNTHTNAYYRREAIHREAESKGFTIETPELDEELIHASIRLAWHLRQFVGVIPSQN